MFSVVKMDDFLLGEEGRKEVAICGRVIKYDCSTWLPTSLTPQSNGNDMGNGNGKEVAGNKEGDGKGGKRNGNGDKGGRQATQRTTARVGRAIATAMRMAGDKEGNGEGGKSNGNDNEGGR